MRCNDTQPKLSLFHQNGYLLLLLDIFEFSVEILVIHYAIPIKCFTSIPLSFVKVSLSVGKGSR